MQEVQKAIDREYPYFQHHIESIKSKIKMTTDDLANSLLNFPKHTPVVFKYNHGDYYAGAFLSAKNNGEDYADLSAELEIDEQVEEIANASNCACIIILEGKL